MNEEKNEESEEYVPTFAALNCGVTANSIREAIEKSGYPFQAVVAEIIKGVLEGRNHWYRIQEEWAYVDLELQQSRAIDILVQVPLNKDANEQSYTSRLYAQLNLLIECKQSELPYVLFLRNTSPAEQNDFPEIFGLRDSYIRIFSSSAEGEKHRRFSHWMTLHDALFFSDLPFFDSPAPYAISVAKAVRRGGSKIEIGGEDTYRSLTLPLMKAADHLRLLSAPINNKHRPLLRIAVSLVVLRAPMIGVILNGESHEMLALPWVRVSHFEPVTETESVHFQNGRTRYYDVVHEEFLAKYLEIAIRDADVAAHRLELHWTEVNEGVALSDMSETHEGLAPLPESYREYLQDPCSMRISRRPHALSISLELDSEEPSTDELRWVDEYPWLTPEEE